VSACLNFNKKRPFVCPLTGNFLKTTKVLSVWRDFMDKRQEKIFFETLYQESGIKRKPPSTFSSDSQRKRYSRFVTAKEGKPGGSLKKTIAEVKKTAKKRAKKEVQKVEIKAGKTIEQIEHDLYKRYEDLEYFQKVLIKRKYLVALGFEEATATQEKACDSLCKAFIPFFAQEKKEGRKRFSPEDYKGCFKSLLEELEETGDINIEEFKESEDEQNS